MNEKEVSKKGRGIEVAVLNEANVKYCWDLRILNQ